MTQTTTEKRGNKLDDYSAAIGTGEIAELRALASRLQGKSVQMVNSTSVGGGVAEMLIRLVPLIEELGLKIRWDVITGGDDFSPLARRFTMRCTAVGTICQTVALIHFSPIPNRIART